MNKLRQKKQQTLRFLFGSFSATALMFTFQACYGMPDNYRYVMTGKVVSESTEEPIPDIRVIAERNGVMMDEIVSTDTNGYFTLNVGLMRLDSVNVHLKDEDGENHGSYADLDTLMSVEDVISRTNVFKMKEKSVE